MKISDGIQNIFNLLEFVNTNFDNLKLFVLDIKEHAPCVTYDEQQKKFNLSANFLKENINYTDNFAAYNGKVKIMFNHTVSLRMTRGSQDIVENYVKQLKEEFGDFEHPPEMKNKETFYTFKKSVNIAEHFKLNYEVQLICYDN